MSRRWARALAAVVAAGALVVPAAAASARPPDDPVRVVDGLSQWPRFAVGDDGAVYVNEPGGWDDPGGLVRYRDGVPDAVLVDPPARVLAVSAGARAVTWARDGVVQQWVDGSVRDLAVPRAYEEATNPDGAVTYGLHGLSPDCAAQVDPALLPAPGPVMSHVAATATTARGVYVADYLGSTVLGVRADGSVRTVAVLPPDVAPMDDYMADAWQLPECARTVPMHNPNRPVDIERGPHGDLYVLAASPTSYADTGTVFRLDARRGTVTRVAGGFGRPLDLAVGADRTAYVAAGLFGEELLAFGRDGAVRTLTAPAYLGGLEWQSRRLYAGVVPDLEDMAGTTSIMAWRVPRR